MTIWIKPNGTEININDNEATVKYVESLGWKLKGEEVDLEALRAEYLKITGEKAHHASGAAKIKADIDEVKKAAE